MDDVQDGATGPETSAEYRDQKGRFAPGNPGRPPGSKAGALKLLDQIGEDNAEAIMQTLCEKAKGGDVRAAEVLLTRLWPARKGRPVTFDLGKLETAKDAADAASAVLREVAAGRLSPEEGAAIAGLLAAHRDATQVAEMEARLERLEGMRGAKR